MVTLSSSLKAYLDNLSRELPTVLQNRQSILSELRSYIREKSEKGKTAQVLFVCTHNSRRSQLAQVWLDAGAAFYGFSALKTYSGGTKATAVHPFTLAALQRAGWQVDQPGTSLSANRHYRLKESPDIVLFSKTYDHSDNPKSEFIAVMVCSEADADCPYVAGAEKRLSLPYEDPGDYDEKADADAQYDRIGREIAREMLWVFGG